MSVGQSVKEFTFISYFLFSYYSWDRCDYAPLATERPDTPDIPPSTTVRSCNGAD